MKHAPRRLCLLAAVSLACAPAAAAQSKTPPPKSPTRTAPAGQKPQSDRGAKARARRLAAAALVEAAESARSIEHAADRVSIEAAAADALWPLDEAAARSMLRRAWEFTTAPGALGAFAPEEEGARMGARERIRAARQAVVSYAAKHDTRLAESFMREFESGLPAEEGEDGEGSAGADEGARARSPWREPSREGWRRLWTANELLEDDAYEMAAAVVAPLANERANRPFLDFLLRLRARSPRDADPLYLRLLERTRADAAADVGDVLLLSTPVVSPDLFVSVEPDGSVSFAPFHRGARAEADADAPLPARARRAFFDTAAAVLLRPAAPHGGAPTAAAALPTYFAVGRLLPFFEQEAPQYAAQLRARLAGLAQEIGEERRDAVSSRMGLERLTPRNSVDPLQNPLERLARATTDEERDRIRFEAVSVASHRKLWERARQLAGEIGDASTRRGALLLLAVDQVKNLGAAFRDEEGEDVYERAAGFARAADVPAGVRAYGLAQAAELAAQKGKRRRASELFGEAAAAAAQADRGTGLRVVAYTLLAASAARSEDARAWELLTELAAALNEAAGRPEDAEGCAEIKVETAENAFCINLDDEFPQPEEAFGAAARLDPARAFAEARSIKDHATRALSLIAAARAATGPAARRR